MKPEFVKYLAVLLSLCLYLGNAQISLSRNEILLDNSPVEILKARNQAVEEILQASGDTVTAETKERLKEIINGILDFEELSRLSLGKYWKERTEQEKKDFVNVFQQLIKNSSVKKLEIYKADRLVYEEPEINGTKAKVTTIAYKKRKQVEIVYKMHKVNGTWLVYDMEIDGVSTARNYRESFYKQIAKSSYKEMYEKLVKRLKEQEKGG
jgi:phospholipid transport system substrate-binding protein